MFIALIELLWYIWFYPEVFDNTFQYARRVLSTVVSGVGWFMVRGTPWSPWKTLEFNIWFQGRLKSPWKEEFFVKVLENNGNSLNFFGMGNSKGYIKNWAHISNLQHDFAKNFCSTCTFACWVKSDFRTLHSGISFFMWSNGRQRPTPSSMCCLGLRGLVFTFAFSFQLSVLHLHSALGFGRCILRLVTSWT